MIISDDEVEAAMRAFYHDADHVLRPTDSDDKDDLRRWTNDMRAALSAAAKVRAIREVDGEVTMDLAKMQQLANEAADRFLATTPTDNLEAGAGDLVEMLLAAYQAVAEWPEKRMPGVDITTLGEGFSDLLRLRNIVPEAAAQLSAVTAENARLTRERDEARTLVTEANNSLYGSQGYFHSLNGGAFDKYHLASGIEALKESSRKAYLAAAENARLREALEPFAALGELVLAEAPAFRAAHAAWSFESSDGPHLITLDAFRAAHVVLSQEAPK